MCWNRRIPIWLQAMSWIFYYGSMKNVLIRGANLIKKRTKISLNWVSQAWNFFKFLSSKRTIIFSRNFNCLKSFLTVGVLHKNHMYCVQCTHNYNIDLRLQCKIYAKRWVWSKWYHQHFHHFFGWSIWLRLMMMTMTDRRNLIRPTPQKGLKKGQPYP